MNTAAALVSAEAQRSLPVLLAVLLLVSGLLLAAITGISNAAVKRPILLPVWCLIPALSIAVIPGPGGIAVDLSPLGLVAERLAQGW
jgi:sulfite exporter TauE/SafE